MTDKQKCSHYYKDHMFTIKELQKHRDEMQKIDDSFKAFYLTGLITICSAVGYALYTLGLLIITITIILYLIGLYIIIYNMIRWNK